jgi:hypothetical protein
MLLGRRGVWPFVTGWLALAMVLLAAIYLGSWLAGSH